MHSSLHIYLKRKWPASFAGPGYRMHQTRGCRRKTACLHRLGVTVLEMLIKNRTRFIKKRSSRIFSELELEVYCKTTVWGPRRVSIVKQQEVKRDWLEEVEEIRIDFVFCEVKESRTFQTSKRRRRPYLPTYSAQIASPQRHTFCAYIYDLGQSK